MSKHINQSSDLPKELPKALAIGSKDAWHLVFSKAITLSDLPQLANEIAHVIGKKSPFCLWLHGDMGAGKTTLTQSLMRSLGVPSTIAVLSPTYTYMSEYKNEAGQWFAHLDFYRADPPCHPEDLGLVDIRDYDGFIVEWPSQMIPAAPLIPTALLTISQSKHGRSYSLWTKA